MAYQGKSASRLPVGLVAEIVGSRQNFPLNHATEAYRIGQFREPVKYKLSSAFSKGIKAGEYVDLYGFTCNVPDLLMSIPRMKNWYLASKEPNNFRMKINYRNQPSRYLNFVDDTGTPSNDGTTENGSSLVSLVPTFTIDNTTNKTELDFFAGLTPGEDIWMGTQSTAAKTGGTGGTGSSMTAMTNNRKDRPVSGIYRVDIGGVQINYVAKENSKWVMKGVVPGDRKTYNDLQFVNSYLTTGTIEMMGAYLSDEYVQMIKDEISAAGTQPAVKIYAQGAPGTAPGIPLIIAYDAGTCTVRGDLEGGDDMGHATLNISYEAPFNSDDTVAGDSMDFDTTPGQLTFKALS